MKENIWKNTMVIPSYEEKKNLKRQLTVSNKSFLPILQLASYLRVGKLNAFSCDCQQDKDVCYHHLFLMLDWIFQARSRNTAIHIGEEEVKLSLFEDDMTLRNPQKYQLSQTNQTRFQGNKLAYNSFTDFFLKLVIDN